MNTVMVMGGSFIRAASCPTLARDASASTELTSQDKHKDTKGTKAEVLPRRTRSYAESTELLRREAPRFLSLRFSALSAVMSVFVPCVSKFDRVAETTPQKYGAPRVFT
jgi:hypothetical protein